MTLANNSKVSLVRLIRGRDAMNDRVLSLVSKRKLKGRVPLQLFNVMSTTSQGFQ